MVAVVLQTAYLSPPVAMSAYYLKQVVKEWSLGTIYKGMFEFMMLQCVAVALIVVFPKIVTTFPEQLRAEGAAIKTEEVDDSANRLEEDPLKAGAGTAAGGGGGGEPRKRRTGDPEEVGSRSHSTPGCPPALSF